MLDTLQVLHFIFELSSFEKKEQYEDDENKNKGQLYEIYWITTDNSHPNRATKHHIYNSGLHLTILPDVPLRFRHRFRRL
ncbi:MAG: hypothetical protein LUH63_03380 [Parabacteroides sp.]|nr:hypothetical protein [Parabacteroides sp.]